MFRIRRIHDDVLPINQRALEEVKLIFLEHFKGAPSEDIDELPERLCNPFKKRFRTVLYVADNTKGHVTGFAMVLFDPELHFAYVDYIAVSSGIKGRGIGAALYEHIRDEALGMGASGVYLECLPDESADCADEALRKENGARLKFYERYGARPIVGTAYESQVPGGYDDCLPYLIFDGLDRERALAQKTVRGVIRAILERKYGDMCPPEYVQTVVDSVRDPVELREWKYVKPERAATLHRAAEPARWPIVTTVNDKHMIHHIRERGYVEAPVRIKAILARLEPSGLIEPIRVRTHAMSHIEAVHARELISYLRRACASVGEGQSVYPYVFPVRNATRPPRELSVRAGYYCIDTFTPIHRNAFPAAKRAVDCALTAAEEILQGRRLAYALVRPPGHHAEHRSFGGFCYFNNAAVAANFLSRHGKVAILDLDYHHGNGQQDIFYRRADVLTVSVHGDPSFAYPYFTGFSDERGEDAGEGFNLNIPLPEVLETDRYFRALNKAMKAIAAFDPAFVVLALGFDPAKGDPTGTWHLLAKDFDRIGRTVGGFGMPVLVVQEGGYRTRTLGTNARSFFTGLIAGAYQT